MHPVASPLTTTCARADPLTPALRALRPVHVSPFSCHSPRGPAFTAGILLWRAHACQESNTVTFLNRSRADTGVYTVPCEPCDRACPMAVPIHLHLGDPEREDRQLRGILG